MSAPSSRDENGNHIPDMCERAVSGDYNGGRLSCWHRGKKWTSRQGHGGKVIVVTELMSCAVKLD